LIFAGALLAGALRYRVLRFMWLAVLSLGLGAFAYLHHAHGEGALWVISGLGFAMTSARAWQLKRFPRDTPRAESFGQAGGGWLRGNRQRVSEERFRSRIIDDCRGPLSLSQISARDVRASRHSRRHRLMVLALGMAHLLHRRLRHPQ
jgi:hypothetical protein